MFSVYVSLLNPGSRCGCEEAVLASPSCGQRNVSDPDNGDSSREQDPVLDQSRASDGTAERSVREGLAKNGGMEGRKPSDRSDGADALGSESGPV